MFTENPETTRANPTNPQSHTSPPPPFTNLDSLTHDQLHGLSDPLKDFVNESAATFNPEPLVGALGRHGLSFDHAYDIADRNQAMQLNTSLGVPDQPLSATVPKPPSIAPESNLEDRGDQLFSQATGEQSAIQDMQRQLDQEQPPTTLNPVTGILGAVVPEQLPLVRPSNPLNLPNPANLPNPTDLANLAHAAIQKGYDPQRVAAHYEALTGQAFTNYDPTIHLH